MAAEVDAASVQPRARSARRHAIDVWTILPFVIFLGVYAVVPRFAQDKQLTTLIYIGINVLLALGLNLLMGYAGQVSLGHAAFFGLGAYTSAILALKPIQAEVIPGMSVGIGIMTGCAVLISLTRVTGWKLASGVTALLLLSWIVRLAGLAIPIAVVVFAVGMTLFGLATKIGWRKTAVAGVASILMMGLCASFLSGVLARGSASPWTAMIVGVFVTGLVAYLIGGQVLRLKGHYLAMATLGFGIIVEIVFKQWTAVTGGSSDGIYGIPTIQFMDSLPAPLRRLYEMAAGGSITLREQYFYLVWGFVFIALILAVNIVRSRVGRAFRAVHGSESAAESLGVDTSRYKVQVLVLSAAMASVAGSLHAHNAGIGYICPSDFGFMVSVQLMVMVVVGGMASIWGALFGATVIQLLKDWLLTIEKADVSMLGIKLNGLDPIVFGGVLIIVMILLPQGCVRGLTDLAAASYRAVRKVKT